MKMWIEMSRDENHGGDEWGFTKCIWAPTYKKSVRKDLSWPFWDNVNKVKTGDIVFHLRGKGKKAEFVGFSSVKTNGHVTLDRPSIPGSWAYCTRFYRAFLGEYTKFDNPINLYQLFKEKDMDFRKYYEHKNWPKNLFYTIQKDEIRCLNGGYLSEIDEVLLVIIFDNFEALTEQNIPVDLSVPTSTVLKEIKARVGHARFSTNVKNNYNNQCCFPSCRILDRNFLVASHITRWAVNREKRGDTSNGLCLCLFHDKAFELGYFSLDNNFRICVEKRNDHSQIFKEYVSRYIGMTISKGHVEPDREALAEHRKRSIILSKGSV